MSLRWYCPQACSVTRGWIDLPSLAAKTEFEAIRNVEEWRAYRRYSIPVTRVIRKPKSWTPPPFSLENARLPDSLHAETCSMVRELHEWMPEPPQVTTHFLAYYCDPYARKDPVSICAKAEDSHKYTDKKPDVTCEHCGLILLLARN